jgi:hypothetical protein
MPFTGTEVGGRIAAMLRRGAYQLMGAAMYSPVGYFTPLPKQAIYGENHKSRVHIYGVNELLFRYFHKGGLATAQKKARLVGNDTRRNQKFSIDNHSPLCSECFQCFLLLGEECSKNTEYIKRATIQQSPKK